jgi:hypothetical protein
MGRPKLTHCNRGHLFDSSNIYLPKNGRRQCKKCIKIRRTTIYKNNPKYYENAIKWAKNNPEKRKETMRKYKEKYPERVKESQKKYRLNNPKKGKLIDEKRKLEQYGLTIEKYNEILTSQFGVCAICNKAETARHQIGTLRKLAVDHSHKTGKVRGLLCSRCNTGIGYFNDDIILFMSAIKYLNK